MGLAQKKPTATQGMALALATGCTCHRQASASASSQPHLPTDSQVRTPPRSETTCFGPVWWFFFSYSFNKKQKQKKNTRLTSHSWSITLCALMWTTDSSAHYRMHWSLYFYSLYQYFQLLVANILWFVVKKNNWKFLPEMKYNCTFNVLESLYMY